MFTIDIPNTIKKEDEKFYKITQAVYLFCLSIHTFLIFLFEYFGVREMVIFNMFISLPIFTIAFLINKKGLLSLAFMLASTELILHQTLTIYYIGWDAGVQYYYIFIAVFMFFNYKWNFKSQIFFVTLITIIYLLLYSLFRNDRIYTLHQIAYDITNVAMIILTISSIALLLNYFVKGANISEKKLESLVEERTKELEQSQKDAISMLGEAGHYNDYNTGVHIWRMAQYASLLAKNYGLDEKEVKLIELAAPMHDTGKIGIPDYILQKPLKLKDNEWEIMKSHCVLGYKILNQSDSKLFKLASKIALNHHEKWDGSGYPRGLTQEDIPLEARIVSIADVFDALTMEREYKKEWSVKEALTYLEENKSIQFDPKLVDIFISLEDEIIKIKDYWDSKDFED